MKKLTVDTSTTKRTKLKPVTMENSQTQRQGNEKNNNRAPEGEEPDKSFLNQSESLPADGDSGLRWVKPTNPENMD